MKVIKPRDNIGIISILILTAMSFAQVLGFSFVSWDDSTMVVQNAILSLPFGSAVKSAFGQFYFGDYIPVVLLSFWSDAQLFGLDNPGGFHFVNLCLHLANIVLLKIWLEHLKLERRMILFVCLMFALHPLQVESVAWVSERKGLLCTLFTLSALLCARDHAKATQFRIFYPFFFLIALLCKTATILTPALLALYDRLISRNPVRQIIRDHAIPLLISAILAIVRVAAYANHKTEFASETTSAERWLRWPLVSLDALGFYVGRFFAPINLSIIYPGFEINFSMVLNLVMIVAVFVGLWMAWRKNSDRRMIFFFAAFLLYMLPVLQIIPRLNFVNDRYMYFSVVGLAGLIGLAIPQSSNLTPKLRNIFLAVIALILAMLSFQRTKVWNNSRDLFQDTVAKAPWSGLAHLSLGRSLEESGDYASAISEYGSAASIDPAVSAMAYSNISMLFSKPELPSLYSLEKARMYLERAVKSPTTTFQRLGIKFNMARLQLLIGHKDKARNLTEELLREIEDFHDGRIEYLRQLTEALHTSAQKL